MIVALLVVAAVEAAGFAGFKLVPDTGIYAGGSLWPAPLGGLAGQAGGLPALIFVSALAAGLLVLAMPTRRRRVLYALVCGYWFLFPGVDALGALAVLVATRTTTRGRRAAAITVAGLAHPVAALTSAPLVAGRTRVALAGVAVLTGAAIVAVGLYDGWTTTDRYALPLVTILMSGAAR